MSDETRLPGAVGASWRAFLESYEPLRPELYRYCRHLTRSPWDAEDLVQDALARAFVALGQLGSAPPNPRAWLFRVASNLWIDRARRGRASDFHEHAHASEGDPRATREAVGTLLGQLSPQERAAVVLKDVLDFSLEEVASTLSTSVGAVKTALHRGRGKLATEPSDPQRSVKPATLDAFCAAFNAGDIDRLATLLLEDASAEVVGATLQFGREAAKRTVLDGMLFGIARTKAHGLLDERYFEGVLANPPRVEARASRDEWLLLHWYAHEGGEAVRAITRIFIADGDVTGVRNYFYNPELVREVCAELGVPSRSNGYRWWGLTQCAKKEV